MSDIHFKKKKADSYDPYDLDTDLRDQLELDIGRVREKIGVPLHGIIVSGDISFAGREVEFDVATKWLRRVSDICGCAPESVFCVPGNHDADRTVFDKSVNLKNLHNTLRPNQAEHVDAILGEALRDEEAAATLFRPLEHYNRFAAKFRCQSHSTGLFWEHRLPLNDGSALVLRGANSVLVSDWSDDNKSRKLILGTLQATVAERANEAAVFVCHHPVDWLLDYDQITPILNARARVQLFGHKHSQIVDVINNCLRIVAGAVHPDRREPKWRPRYNCIGFSVRNTAGSRTLEVELYPRIWSETEPKFIPDYGQCGGAENKIFKLNLESWNPPVGKEMTSPPVRPNSMDPTATSAATNVGQYAEPARTLTYRFLSLPHLVRLEIAQEMKLLREEDEGLFDADLFERILERAATGKRLAELWDLVDARSEDKTVINPYAGV